MKVQIPSDWQAVLVNEFGKQYFKDLETFVHQSYQSNTCFPPKGQIFAAFEACAFDELKVVMIGQDPYHGSGQANGLCFSVADGRKHPPSLVNIFKELESDLNLSYPETGNLLPWAKQGVLMLNATLTVQEGIAGSHQKVGWEKFTDAVIKLISIQKENVVFMLWGGYAKKKGSKIDRNRHLVLESGHPSPLSANRGFWFGHKHFSQCNSYLKRNGLTEIDFRI